MTSHPAHDAPTLAESVQTLVEQGTATTVDVRLLTAAVRAQTRALRWAVGVGIVIVFGLALVLFDNRMQVQQLQRRLCPMVTLSIHQPGQAPPSTARGRDIEAAARALAGSFGCTLPAAAPNGR